MEDMGEGDEVRNEDSALTDDTDESSMIGSKSDLRSAEEGLGGGDIASDLGGGNTVGGGRGSTQLGNVDGPGATPNSIDGSEAGLGGGSGDLGGGGGLGDDLGSLPRDGESGSSPRDESGAAG